MAMFRAKSIEEYLGHIESPNARAALLALRATIRDEAPDAEEVISYGLPAFKQNGILVWYAAFKNHCSLFAGTLVADFADELKDYKTSKGTIQFTPDHPLPEPLVRAIVRARMAENSAKQARAKA